MLSCFNTFANAAPDTIDKFVSKYACEYNVYSEEAKMFQSYLMSKNKLLLINNSFSEEHKKLSRLLVNEYISPKYKLMYSIEQNSSDMNGHTWAPEFIVCNKKIKNIDYFITAIKNKDKTFANVLFYKLVKEQNNYYILPGSIPTNQTISKTEIDPSLYFITPYSKEIRYQNGKATETLYEQ